MRLILSVCRTNVRFISSESIKKNSGHDTSLQCTILNETKNEISQVLTDKTAQFDESSSRSEKENRYNEYGIQMISENLRKQLFNSRSTAVNDDYFQKCLKDLQSFNLGEKREMLSNVELSVPKLLGNSIEEHFYQLGVLQSEPYKLLICGLQVVLPELPQVWSLKPGWTRYENNVIEQVPYPPDDALFFDVEVCKSEGEMPTIATAASSNAWYSWVSDHLAHGVKLFNKSNYTTASLIPLESNTENNKPQISKRKLNKPRIVIGHNVSYDRARVREQYWLQKSGLRFLDSLSLHVCVSGITSYQKHLLKAGVGEENEWSKVSSLNSLSKVHKLYCGTEISKEERELFINGSISDIRNNFQTMMTYCANDVVATHAVLVKLWPLFLKRFPHPVTLAGMLELQSAYVPVNLKWNKYISNARAAYEDLALEAKYLLSQTAKNTCKLSNKELYKDDLWMWDQNWSTKHIKVKKISNFNKKVTSVTSINGYDSSDKTEVYSTLNKLILKFCKLINTKQNLPLRKCFLPGYPEWYRKICSKPTEDGWVPGPVLLTNSMQIAPKLLKLTWKNMPLHYVRGSGWGYISTERTSNKFDDARFPFTIYKNKLFNKADKVFSSEDCSVGVENNIQFNFDERVCQYGFRKLPHRDGDNYNVGNPLSQDYINKFSDNDFSGALTNAHRIMGISKMLSYWRNNRERIESQLVCWLTPKEFSECVRDDFLSLGAILPLIIVSGTLTRRAVEPTWMTASNSVFDRVGSEFRGILEAPQGYCFVGADVDSQELWISSLLGDSYSAGSHGCTPFGWMTLNGHKSDGSDLHSVTAKAVGISRNHAKVLNYARIYGSGQKFAERTLLNFNPGMTPSEASVKASKMYQLTKGKKLFILKEEVLPHIKQRVYSKFQAGEVCKAFGKNIDEIFKEPLWVGGTESDMFNSLEYIANKSNPETPFLNCKLSRALLPNIDNEDKHGNTRINWVVQSSAVDYLHLMLVCMKWLLGDNARFSLSFHDEVHYLIPIKYKYNAALALQITNLLTRTFCVSRVGMTDLPLSVAFFSTVEIDCVLRKDPLDDNKTPSNPHGLLKGYGIPQGESLDIQECIKRSTNVIGK